MTNGLPSRSDSHCPIGRAMVSTTPPGREWNNHPHRPHGIGFRPWTHDTAGSAAVLDARCRNPRCASFIASSQYDDDASLAPSCRYRLAGISSRTLGDHQMMAAISCANRGARNCGHCISCWRCVPFMIASETSFALTNPQGTGACRSSRPTSGCLFPRCIRRIYRADQGRQAACARDDKRRWFETAIRPVSPINNLAF
jgi:hypothetical protein